MRTSLLRLVAVFALTSGCAHLEHGGRGDPPSSYLAGQLGDPLAWGTEETGTCVPRSQTRAHMMERAQAAAPNVAPRAQHRTALLLGGGDYLTQGAYAGAREGRLDCSGADVRHDAQCAGEHLEARWIAPRDQPVGCAKL